MGGSAARVRGRRSWEALLCAAIVLFSTLANDAMGDARGAPIPFAHSIVPSQHEQESTKAVQRSASCKRRRRARDHETAIGGSQTADASLASEV
jgi:hypothetical protein